MNLPSSDTITADPIFQMATGYWISKTLMTAVELEIFTKLAGGKELTLEELKSILRLENRPAEVFTTALVSLGLLTVTNTNTIDGKVRSYSNSDMSELYLDKNKPSYIGDFISMLDKHMYRRYDKLPLALKSNKPVQDDQVESAGKIFEDAKSSKATKEMEVFTRAMYGVSVIPAVSLTKIFDFSTHSKMLDVGGGSGVYSIEVVKAHPHVRATVLDLAPACHVANEYIKQFGLEGRIDTLVDDFVREELPSGYDVVLLSHIVHFLGDEGSKMLLKKIYEKLPKNGCLIISEWFLNDEKTGPVPSALLGLTMIVEQNQGRNYSYKEVKEMLSDSGFENIENRALSGPADILIGYKL
jgi:3-hydroxy-5-methyl-1-naphthoate 3-O-methyltransferase